MTTYVLIFFLLLIAELTYFRIADKFNIIDKPNERSSHSTIVLRGGGIVFLFGVWVWSIFFGFQYPWFLVGLTLVAGISFIDDIHSLPDSLRLVAQFVAALMAFYQLGLFEGFHVVEFTLSGIIYPTLIIILALIVYVGATNIINFMDGINGITACYALAVLIPLMLISDKSDTSLIIVTILAVLVFCLFNLRPKGKAKCFAGDVGSIGIAFIMLFLIGKVMIDKSDFTYIIFLLVYGIDGVLTIFHRILLHENLGVAHRKHAYQLMCNELKIGHVKISLLYMMIQLIVSLGFIYLCPGSILAHWLYLIGTAVILAMTYILFKKKYYHLHEEYLANLNK